MRLDSSAPLIGVPVDVRRLDEQPFHVVGEKYITAISDAAYGLPMLIPALGHDSTWRTSFSASMA